MTPAFIYDDANAIGAATEAQRKEKWTTDVESLIDGSEYRKKYLRHVQFVFSRVQHHVHQRTKKGYVPLRNCARKGRKRCVAGDTCKADFPMTNLRVAKSMLECRGVAKKLKLKVAGRRNSLERFSHRVLANGKVAQHLRSQCSSEAIRTTSRTTGSR